MNFDFRDPEDWKALIAVVVVVGVLLIMNFFTG